MTAQEQQDMEGIDRLLNTTGWHVCDACAANVVTPNNTTVGISAPVVE